jgi:hypothetical protein
MANPKLFRQIFTFFYFLSIGILQLNMLLIFLKALFVCVVLMGRNDS